MSSFFALFLSLFLFLLVLRMASMSSENTKLGFGPLFFAVTSRHDSVQRPFTSLSTTCLFTVISSGGALVGCLGRMGGCGPNCGGPPCGGGVVAGPVALPKRKKYAVAFGGFWI